MRTRHAMAMRVPTLQIAPETNLPRPQLSAAKLKRAAKIRRELEALQGALARLLERPAT